MPVTNQVVLAKELSNHGDSALSLYYYYFGLSGRILSPSRLLCPNQGWQRMYISNVIHTVSRLGITYGVPYVLTFSNTDLN